MVPHAKHELASNNELEKQHGIELDSEAKGDRSWTNEEYNNMYAFADKQSRGDGTEQRTACDGRDTMVLSRTMGLRVAEAVAMHRSQAENALRTGIYHVKNEAKNGKHRQVPLSQEAKNVLTSVCGRWNVVKKYLCNRLKKPIMRSIELRNTSVGTGKTSRRRKDGKGVPMMMAITNSRFMACVITMCRTG
ncbi:phage integrase family protein [Lentibacillus cibarius]|uniref:Phage integrase family protein n=1 Tax=Lentibacillus cibarius TaxID=2583219 RepID=A0A5S3QFU5_9BACI|nr:phage integrase family protein [Lentibacillus cibarius]